MPLYNNLSALTNRLRFTLTLQDKDLTGSVPIKDLRVAVHQLASDGKLGELLVDSITNVSGQIAFSIVDQPQKDNSLPLQPIAKIQYALRDIDGEQIGAAISLQPERGKELPVQKVSVKSHRDKILAPMDAVKTAIGVSFSPKLEQVLNTSKINSLTELRSAVDITKTSGLAPADIKELERLQKHARLQLISRDHKTNQLLVDAGISTVTDITDLTKSVFVEKLKGKVDQKKAEGLYDAALKTVAVANRLALAERVDSANNRTKQTSSTETAPCACDCQSAVSPLAYLADLLEYAVRHVRISGKEITLDQLEVSFFQPFGSLPADCSASETLVRQVRLCVEVLRKKAIKYNVDTSGIIKAYAQKSYQTLLAALGVTYNELRFAQTESGERQQVLADRLGVPLAKLFGFLLTDPSEEKLYEMFGLPTTSPLQPAVKTAEIQSAKLARLNDVWSTIESTLRPVRLDPDIITSDFFAITGSAAEQILEIRKKQLDDLFKNIKPAVANKTTLTKVMTSPSSSVVNGMHGLGLGTEADLDKFNKQRQDRRAYSREVNGEIVPLNFTELSLRKPELDQLLIVRQLAAANAATSADQEEALNILVAIEKRSALIEAWRAEERIKGIVLSPAVFAIPADNLRLQNNAAAFLRWRFNAEALRDWLTALQDRIVQQDSAIASVQAAVDAAEDSHLSALRDDLVNLVIPTTQTLDNLDKKKKWVTNQLLINAHESACRKTTHVAQAIECMQLLLWGIHNQFIEDSKFSLDAPNFAEQWKGLGNYKTWRAAVWVYLYPENLARPSLIDPARRTIVLAVYELLISYWPLLGVDASMKRPEANINWFYWEIAQDRAWFLRANNFFTDADFMSTSWLLKIWEITKDLRHMADQTDKQSTSDVENLTSIASIEAFFFVPLDIAFRLKDAGTPEESLDWLRRAANINNGEPANESARNYLNSLRLSSNSILLDDAWYAAPLPHEAAERIPGGYERRIVITAISAYLDIAEANFARDTAESLARAREDYLTAIDLLESPVFGNPLAPCSTLTVQIGDDRLRETIIRIRDDILGDSLLGQFNRSQIEAVDKAVAAFAKAFKVGDSIASFRKTVSAEYQKLKVSSGKKDNIQTRMVTAAANQKQQTNKKLSAPLFFAGTQIRLPLNPGGLSGIIRAPVFSFCIPPNPVLFLLKLRAESGFFKLNNCMNLAGLKRETQAYSAPTDATSGVAMELVESPSLTTSEFFMPPGATIYRFKVLLERAKQLVSIAQQVEASFLQLLEKKDAEHYSSIRAKQDLGIANATVGLQDLRVHEAQDGKYLSQQQLGRIDATLQHYDNLLDDGLLSTEETALASMRFASLLQTASVAPALQGALGAAAQAQSMISSFNSMYASFERREEEWKFQKFLAGLDKQIAETQQILAEDRYQITLQERRISQLSRDNASDVVEFLSSKFTDRELYIWMSGIVGDAYRYFLQQASSIAKLAQRQLAFERQEPESGIILDDYWTYTSSASQLNTNGESVDRKGMTGSVRLLRDITRLDQQAFLTDRRKTVITKNISLASHDSLAFVRFRETGVLNIATNMDLFDRDFPGDYLRLVKRIRISVIALIPPLDGIKATLSSTGISRVVRGGDRFVETVIATQPETIAISAPISAAGAIELLPEQSEMLLPFEGLGAASSWVFSLPKAANAFDYSTIADVIFSIEYTSLYSDLLRQQVIQRFNADRSFEGERAFSLRQHFADEWYNLHHPELFDDASKKLRPTVELTRSDYPPNLTDGSLKLKHLSIYVVRKEGILDEATISDLSWSWEGQTGPTTNSTFATRNGLLSTRDIPATAWLGNTQDPSSVGRLSFKLGGSFNNKPIENALREGLITDILVAVSVRGQLPLWPV